MLCTKLTREECKTLYADVLQRRDTEAMRRLCRGDLFFLLFVACKRKDIDHDWTYARCREVEENPDGYLDAWSREHYKSSIITFGKTIQDILIDPEVTIGIFSHTRPIAKSFLAQIKTEFENNTFLKNLFPEVLYQNPHKESPRWSLDSGIIVNRKSNPKESTIEAWGLVDGQPTSKHFKILVYDDVVTKESVSTPEMIQKVTESFGLSLNLGSQECRKRYIGTRYHANDTYHTIMSRGTATPRIYPATDDGTLKGKPVFFTQKQFDDKVRDMGSYVASCQLLQNPLEDKAMGFKDEWLMFYDLLRNNGKWNFYILVDSASEKKKSSDYTVMAVVGLAPDNNFYLVDGVRDRMNLTERTKCLFALVRKWKPKKVGYEKYGKDADIEHIEYVQEQEGYRFPIKELGGSMPKNDRIRRLQPVFENRRFYMPRRLLFVSVEGKAVDFIQHLLNDEYKPFPVSAHDDMLDAISRIMDEDLCAVFPEIKEELPFAVSTKADIYDVLKPNIQQNQNVYHPIR
jgi:predicted phage terminase large subunit-like protein